MVFYHLTYRVTDGQSLVPEFDAVTRFGYLGVVLFFMISGFVILWSADGRTPAQFLISRFSRLYPIFWVAIGLTVLTVSALGNATFSAANILANMTMVAGYLNQPYVDGVYWTLQVELKFYALVLLLLVFRQMGQIDRWLLVWLVASIAAWFVPVVGALTIHPFGAYFIAGATMFRAREDGLTKGRTAILAVCLGLCMTEAHEATHMYIFDDNPIYPIASSLFVAGLFLLMTAAALGYARVRERVFLFNLGMMTYPLYLLHNVIGKHLYDALPTGRFVSISVVIGVLFVGCYLLAMYVDRPLSRIANRLLRSTADWGRARLGAASPRQSGS